MKIIDCINSATVKSDCPARIDSLRDSISDHVDYLSYYESLYDRLCEPDTSEFILLGHDLWILQQLVKKEIFSLRNECIELQAILSFLLKDVVGDENGKE